MKPLTPKQQIALRSIQSYMAANGTAPSIRELRSEMSKHGLVVKSLRSVLLYLRALQEAGYIRREDRKQGMELVTRRQESFVQLPVYGAANAGLPSLVAEQNLEGYLTVAKRLVPATRAFAIRVSGDSMDRSVVRGQRIEDGDYVVLDPRVGNLQGGEKVVVVIDGLATVKTFRREGQNVIKLVPESSNPNHHPIYLTSADDFVISGKVITVLKHQS